MNYGPYVSAQSPIVSGQTLMAPSKSIVSGQSPGAPSKQWGGTTMQGATTAEGEEPQSVQVHAWKLASGGYAQPGRYQLFSMGPDGKPNTEDDLKAWDP